MEKNEENKKPFYKKWWFWVIVAIILIGGLGSSGEKNQNETNITSTTTSAIEQTKITVVDFSQMTEEEIKNWCDSNKIGFNVTNEYSDTVEKGAFVSQSKEPNSTIYEGDRITIVYSLGKEPSTEYKNALKKAESYSKTMHMSKKRIYEQLTSEYGENFPADAAQYAIDNLVADWNANALEKAKSYQETMNMSKQRIYEQLTSEYGEGFTAEEAQYAINNLD